ncbi:MAG: hypothetical protein ABR520_10935 [Mycobacteriales bacterium]|nr:hypothetical protein [Frankia sp.]
MRGDRGDVLTSWIVKLVVVLVVVGVILFDAISIGVAHVNTTDQAQQAARTASATWQNTKNVDEAYDAAVEFAGEHDATVRRSSFLAYPDGHVTLELRRTARTLIVRRLGFSKKWADVRESASGKFEA